MVSNGKKHTLELILDELSKSIKNNSERWDTLYSALVLSYVHAAKKVVGKHVASTPLLTATIEPSQKNFNLKRNDGVACVPKENSIDIDAFDILLSANLRDIPLLWEGTTGTGKTHLTEHFFDAVAGRDSYTSLRVCKGGKSNVLQDFTKREIKDGYPKARLKKETLQKRIGLFADEINRGDFNDISQVVDSKAVVGGEVGTIGIPVPIIEHKNKKDVVTYNGELKRFQVIGAQNPPKKEYVGVLGELDAALENRFLKFLFGNIASSVSSSLWCIEDKPKNLHEEFLEEFVSKASEYLGVNGETFDNIDEDWLSIYAFITDSKKTKKDLLVSAPEFSDLAIFLLSNEDIEKALESEKLIIKEWRTNLNIPEFSYNPSFDSTHNDLAQITDFTGTLREDVSSRDIVKVKQYADSFNTIKLFKESFNSQDPLADFGKLQKADQNSDFDKSAIALDDVSYGLNLLLTSKQLDDSKDTNGVVNHLLKEYINLEEKVSAKIKNSSNPFEFNDATKGVKYYSALYAANLAVSNKKAGYSSVFIDALSNIVDYLGHGLRLQSPISQVMNARLIGDLSTLAGFVSTYESNIDALANKEKKADPMRLLEIMYEVYEDRKDIESVSFPRIFEHRIPRIIG